MFNMHRARGEVIIIIEEIFIADRWSILKLVLKQKVSGSFDILLYRRQDISYDNTFDGRISMIILMEVITFSV